MNRVCRVVCLGAVLSMGVAGYADTFSFQITGTQNSGSGYLSAVPDATTAGAFDVTSISGTLNGQSITALLPCTTFNPSSPCGGAGLTFGYDNLIYPGGIAPFYINELDLNGLGFVAGSTAVDVAFSSSHLDELNYNGAPPDAPQIIVSFAVSPVPEPSSFLLLASGLLGMLGVAGVRRFRDRLVKVA